jgi:hypothetical protein
MYDGTDHRKASACTGQRRKARISIEPRAEFQPASPVYMEPHTVRRAGYQNLLFL